MNPLPAPSFGYHPPTGFRFLVHIEGLPAVVTPDSWFQEVSGLTATVETENYREMGRMEPHHLPSGISFSDLTLKRGLFVDSALTTWCRMAIENFVFHPKDLVIQLINGQRETLSAWRIEGAIPTSWSVSSFNAESSSLVIESLTLKYHRFTFQPIIN
ncbi:MAG: phage tail protein [Bacteroidia bacterium]|nr:phage tail protein [Bacteroidia bacterium]